MNSNERRFSWDGALITAASLVVESSRGAAVLPQQQVDEHRDGEEGASHGGVAAQEEEEVAEEAEEDHPDHVELEEQVEGVKASDYGAQVLDEGREAWKSRRRRLKSRVEELQFGPYGVTERSQFCVVYEAQGW